MPRRTRFVFPLVFALAAIAGVPQAGARQSDAGSTYEATVPLSANTERGRSEAFAEAMRQVLARATGRPAAADEPALASLVKDAARYVQLYRQVQGGQLLVGFDGRRIEHFISAADPSQVRVVTVAVSGIVGVDAYAEVTARLEALMQLSNLEVAELSTDTVLYKARARGELQQLAQAIEQIPHLRPDAGTGGSPSPDTLRYRYSP